MPDGQPLTKSSLSVAVKVTANRHLPTASLGNVTRKTLAHNQIQEGWQLFRSVGERAQHIFLNHVQYVGTADEIGYFKVSSGAGGVRHGVCKTCVQVGASIFQHSAVETQQTSSSILSLFSLISNSDIWNASLHNSFQHRNLDTKRRCV